MNTRAQLLCAWSGAVFVVLFGVGWCLLAGYLPPHAPSATAEEIVAFYQGRLDLVRAGLLVTMLGTAFYAPFTAAIAAQMRRIEGDRPALTYAQLVSGAAVVILLLYPLMHWAVLTFRPERDPALLYLLNDMAWLPFIMVFSPALMQNLTLAAAVFADASTPAVYPRWFAYFNLWVAAAYLPGGLVVFFKTGPFAWNGLLAFWLALTFVALWCLVTMHLTAKAIRSEGGAAAPGRYAVAGSP